MNNSSEERRRLPRPPSRPEFFLASRIALDLGISPEQVRRTCGTPAAYVYGQERVPMWSTAQVTSLQRRLAPERRRGDR